MKCDVLGVGTSSALQKQKSFVWQLAVQIAQMRFDRSLHMLKIASYNILDPYFAVKWADAEGLAASAQHEDIHVLRKACSDQDWQQYSNWDERIDQIVQNIFLADADVICLQEVVQETLDDLKQRLEDDGYFLGTSAMHTPKNPSKQFSRIYGTAIFYKECILKSFGEYEGIPGGDHTRRASWVTVKKEEHIYHIVSVHLQGYWLDNLDRETLANSSLEGYYELQSYLEQMPTEDIHVQVVCGDFNEGPFSGTPYSRSQFMEKNLFVCDSDLSPTHKKGNKLDWIFVRFLLGEGTIAAAKVKGLFKEASDHQLILSQIVC